MTERSSIGAAIATIAEGRSLGAAEAADAMRDLLEGKATPAQVGAFLIGLRVKGETVEEVAGLARAMRAAAVPVEPRRDDLVDLCGTGGDGSGTFNISTAAALVAAGAGAAVAKHGNRSASSLCGSADVLEALGVPIDLEAAAAARSIDEVGFAFLFARAYHPAMRHVAGPRSELATRTVFNILGPMTSPAGVRRQLIGIFSDALRPLVASVLGELGSEHVWVVHGEGGLDELSIAGETAVTELRSSEERELVVAPEDAGLERRPLESLRGGDAATNARIIEAVLEGERGPHRDAVLLNAAAALLVHGSAGSLREGAAMAAEAVDSGRARDVLGRLRGLS